MIEEFIFPDFCDNLECYESLEFLLLDRYEDTIFRESPCLILPSCDICPVDGRISFEDDLESIRIESVDSDLFDIILVFSETECYHRLIEEEEILSVDVLYRTICDIDIDSLTRGLDHDLRWRYLEVG